MNPSPSNKHIELRVNRDFGEIITVYFDFLKQNLKKFTNIFIAYNGIFLIGLLLVSYLFVSGFMQILSIQNQSLYTGETADEGAALSLIGIGFVVYLLIFVIVAMLNYSIAASYLVEYDRQKGMGFERKQLWERIRNNIGNIFLFVVLLVLMFLLVMVVGVILAFIPILGTLAYYVVMFFMYSWFGVSFMFMLHENKGAIEAYGEGWNLVYRNFWKSVGVNFVLGLLNGMLLLLVLMIPIIIVGFYTYHLVDEGKDIVDQVVPTVVYTLALCLFLIVAVFNNCLTQLGNGMLYFSLHEKVFNTNARSKIEQIGEA